MAEEKKMNDGEFQFIQEKVRQNGTRKNRIFRKVFFNLLFGFLFGAVACITFVLLFPWAQERFMEEPVKEISIPKDEEPEQEESDLSAEIESETEPEVPVQEPVEVTQETEGEAESQTQEAETKEPDGDAVEEPEEPISMEILPSDYVMLSEKIRAVGRNALSSMVVVTAQKSDTDWFNTFTEDSCEVSGLLIEDNGVEQLILTCYEELEGAQNLRVTFADNNDAPAVLKKYDKLTNLAVLGVNLSDISESTASKITMVTWGNSNITKVTEPVLAVGSPMGISGSMLLGRIAAITFDVPIVDGEYQLLLTDMQRSEGGSGALFNLEGELVGWIEETYLHPGNKTMLTAYGISDLKSIIQHLCNNQDIAYLGVTGGELTKEMRTELNSSAGVYIAGVEMDSPAMEAGVQSGDILVDISGQKVRSVEEMRDLLLNFSTEQTITIKVMRKGKDGFKEISFEVALKALE